MSAPLRQIRQNKISGFRRCQGRQAKSPGPPWNRSIFYARLPLGVYRQGGQIISSAAAGKQIKCNKEKKVNNNLPQVIYLAFIHQEQWQLCNTCIDYTHRPVDAYLTLISCLNAKCLKTSCLCAGLQDLLSDECLIL